MYVCVCLIFKLDFIQGDQHAPQVHPTISTNFILRKLCGEIPYAPVSNLTVTIIEEQTLKQSLVSLEI